jgi:septal ring factor EnvC (AmiA/AmiB activator)
LKINIISFKSKLCLLLAACFLQASLAYAQKISELNKNLENLKKNISKMEQEKNKIAKEKNEVTKEIKTIQNKVVTIAREVKTFERNIDKINEKVTSLSASEQQIMEDLSKERNKTVEIISVLERLLTVPKGIVILQPTKPTDTIRTALLLNGIISYLNEHSVQLKIKLSNLQSLRKQITVQKQELKSVRDEMSIKKNKISEELSKKKKFETILERKKRK